MVKFGEAWTRYRGTWVLSGAVWLFFGYNLWYQRKCWIGNLEPGEEYKGRPIKPGD
jgi:hypothetical protein